VLYWFKLARDGKGGVDFIPHRIDDDSGVGTQVVATDVNGDGLPHTRIGHDGRLMMKREERRGPTLDESEEINRSAVRCRVMRAPVGHSQSAWRISDVVTSW